MKHVLKRLILTLGLMAFCASPFATFDPVNDDTDLFRNNPNIPAERPNVLIILDNTANWSSGEKFTSEKTALVSLVGDATTGLDSSFNVGLMIMGQGGSCRFTTLSGSPAPDGGYVRFGIRQMTTANKAALSGIVSNFADASCNNVATGGDQGSSAVGAQAMHEAYLYFGGLTSRAGITQERRDYTGNPNNTLAGNQPGNPLLSGTAIQYQSPITDGCQKNYIIFISNGPFDNGDDSPSATLYAGTGGLVPGATPITLNPSGSQSNWTDEYAFYLANVGVTRTISSVTYNPKVFSYAIEVDPSTSGQGPSHTALMKSMAQQGKGKYFGVTSGGTGQAILDALLTIFTEIQAVNSVFASSTLPVSVNVRGTNLNQLYIGVFRPDAKDLPRWLGNLKAYQLKKDPATGAVFTVDSQLVAAINSSTGFITSTAQSFWTTADEPTATYWDFRPAEANGAGGGSDLPDGELVEKGGAAQRLRAAYYAQGVNGTPFRPLYTCTQGSTFPVCKTDYSTTPSSLSATPFRADDTVDNVDITASELGLNPRSVTGISSAVIKPITDLVDRRNVSIDNVGGTVYLDSGDALHPNSFSYIYPDSSFRCYFDLSNSSTVSATLNNSAVARAATKFSRQGASYADVTIAAHGLAAGTTVIVTGTTNYNTSASGVTISSVPDANTIRINLPLPGGTANETAGTVTTSSTTVTVTAVNHGFSTSTSDPGTYVTIAGATPTSFNAAHPITVVDANTFTFQHTTALAPSGTITATGKGRTVTATLRLDQAGGTSACGETSHGYAVGQQINVTNSYDSSFFSLGFNGSFTVLASPAPTATSFSYQTPTAVTGTNASTAVYTTASATTATVYLYLSPADYVYPTPPGFVNGSRIYISGIQGQGLNGTFTVSNLTDYWATYGCCQGYWIFNITIPSGAPSYSYRANAATPVRIGTVPLPTVTATMANHEYAVGDLITVSGATATADGPTGASHNSTTWAVTSVLDANTFQYSTGVAYDAPGGAPVSNKTTAPRAYATIASHGYGVAGTAVNPFVVANAAPGGYNGTFTTAHVVDGNTVSYELTGLQGTNTGVGVTATTPSATALVTLPGHGFIVGDSVTVGGAVEGQFNGTFTVVSVPSVDTFTYTMGSIGSSTATGTITALASRQRRDLVDWVRGKDNFEDENADTSFIDPRATIHGDVLHSRPAVVNYNRLTVSDPPNADNDVYIYYGGNDGIFRAVKGGFGSTAGAAEPGMEVWGFVAKEHFSYFNRLRINNPAISSVQRKPYFFDGPIGTYTLDTNNDAKIVAADGDKVWLFLTMRRGGRAIYALDVSDPLTPKMLWRKGCPSLSTTAANIDAVSGCDLGFAELGQTWSEPKVLSMNASSDPVLLFGAGYDSPVEDFDPACVTSNIAASVTTSSAQGTLCTSVTAARTMGRGLYAVNAKTGEILWQASGHARTDGSTHPYKVVSGMDYSIASDLAVIVGDGAARPFRAYVGDTGGNMWRIDFGDASPSNWTVVKLASIADMTSTVSNTEAVSGIVRNVRPGQRKFLFAPDIVGASGYDMIIAGTGDREHPFDTTVVNRVYAFKDKVQSTTPAADPSTGVPLQTTITHADTATFGGSTIKTLLDVSTNCIQVAANCSGTAPELAVSGSTASQNTAAALADTTNYGWFITLAAGEKQVGSTLAAGSGSVVFGTNQPSSAAGGGACAPNLGVARQYAVNFENGGAFSGTSLSTTYAGGGFLPSPVLVYVGLGGATGTGTSAGTGVPVGGTVSGGQLKVGAAASMGGGNDPTGVVCYGASCALAPGKQLYSRLRKFWYKEID